MRVGWFAPSLMVLHCFLGWAMGYLGRCVCWVDSYDFVCWVWAQGGTSLLGTSGFFLANGAADAEDFLLLRLCRLGYTVCHSLSCCTRWVVPNNTNPHSLKKEKKIPSKWFSFLSFFSPQSIPKTSPTREILLVYLFYNIKTLYLYDSYLNYFHLSSSHKKLKA